MIFVVRAAAMSCLAWALAGCALLSPEVPATADQAARAACRQQAEQSYDIRNRADRYKSDFGRDSPYSGQASPQIDRGLVDRYSYDQDYRDCLLSRGGRQTPTSLPATPAGAGPSASRPPPPTRSGPGSPAAASPAPASASDLTRPPALTP